MLFKNEEALGKTKYNTNELYFFGLKKKKKSHNIIQVIKDL